MATWIEPLQLETWIGSVFAGNPTFFGAIALFVISSMAAYFRMNGLTMYFMLGVFFVMFSVYLGNAFMLLFGILGGLALGYTLAKIFE